jgi:L-cysteine/cystine lyase
VLVDGAQSVGAIPVDARASTSTSGAKWLCGPDATGALYVADPESLTVALPSYWGHIDHEPDGTFTPVAGTARFDAGTIPLPSLAGLDAALATAPPWRFEAARAMATRCRALLAERFEVITQPDQATLVTFRPDGDAVETAARLREAGVLVRDLPGTPWVRVSCGYWTSDEDLERLLAALPGPS